MSLPPHPQRKSPRLQGYDYSQSGAYFVTICTHNRESLFGEVVDGEMILNSVGQIAAERWSALPDHHPTIDVDAFVVMPNHVHAIILVGTGPALSGSANTDNAGVIPTPNTPTLSAVVGSYKSSVSRRIRETLHDPTVIVWQTRFHDHIIRDEKSFLKISEYIVNNPAKWHEDTFYTG